MSDTYVPAELRRRVAERARGYCEYCWCQALFTSAPFAVDHIIPVCAGGLTTFDNLAFSCPACNGCKSIKTVGLDPQTQAVGPLFHPRHQRWQDHFTWNEDFTLILGLTPIGRATVRELHLNRENVVNLRHVLRATNRHPPTEPAPGGNGFTNLT